ncbi:hypothetical protein SODG_007581 [Sodalis praecaptivus]
MKNLVSEHILTMSSRQISNLAGKKHSHILRDIESMIVDLGEDPEESVHFWAHPQDGQQYREYLLDREHTECLLIKYSVVPRMRVIKSWHEFEERASQFSIPQTYPEALRIAAQRAEGTQHPNSFAS